MEATCQEITCWHLQTHSKQADNVYSCLGIIASSLLFKKLLFFIHYIHKILVVLPAGARYIALLSRTGDNRRHMSSLCKCFSFTWVTFPNSTSTLEALKKTPTEPHRMIASKRRNNIIFYRSCTGCRVLWQDCKTRSHSKAAQKHLANIRDVFLLHQTHLLFSYMCYCSEKMSYAITSKSISALFPKVT